MNAVGPAMFDEHRGGMASVELRWRKETGRILTKDVAQSKLQIHTSIGVSDYPARPEQKYGVTATHAHVVATKPWTE